MAPSGDDWFELTSVIRDLRAQLSSAMADGTGQDIRFELGPVELDFEVVVNKEHGTEGGLQVGVLSFGAKGARARGVTHHMKLTLQPVGSDGRSTKVTGPGRQLPTG